MKLEFHPGVQRDVNDILTYYEEEDSAALADRFFTAMQKQLARIAEHPERCPLSAEPKIPSHLLLHLEKSVDGRKSLSEYSTDAIIGCSGSNRLTV